VTLKLKSRRGGRRYPPYAFTEEGVAMLSSVLNSPRAVKVNIEIMRAFVRLRKILTSHVELARKLEALERKYDSQFKVVFEAIRQLMASPEKAPKIIGFQLRKKRVSNLEPRASFLFFGLGTLSGHSLAFFAPWRERGSFWHESQKITKLPDGSMQITFRVAGLDEIKRWILSFGPEVAVLEPEKLKEVVRKDLSRNLAQYSTGPIAVRSMKEIRAS